MTSCTHNKMKTSRESSSSQELDGNKMNTSGQSRCLEIMAYDGWQGASAELYGTHNKMKTSRQSSCQEPDGNKMNTSAELSVTQVKKLQEIKQRIDKLTGCQGASAELSATPVKKLEELEERIDKLTDINEEATNDAPVSDAARQWQAAARLRSSPAARQLQARAAMAAVIQSSSSSSPSSSSSSASSSS